jgi:peptidyl-prolyl cis-trans isomerase SurA
MIKYVKILLFIFFLMLTKSLALENKIILKVDNNIITTLDILNEVNYLKFFNRNLNSIEDKEIYQIALKSLTRYEIKKLEVLNGFKTININDEDYLNLLIKNTATDLGFNDLKTFKEELKKKFIDFEKFKEKLEIDLLWNQIIYLKFNEKININEEALSKQLRQQKKFAKEYNLNEIIYESENLNEVDIKYQLIKDEIEKIGFENAAAKYSISGSSSSGGKLGWIDENKIDKNILNQLNAIPINSFTKPIRVSSGFIVLKKNEEKIIEKKLDFEEELKKIVNYERQKQLNSFSNLYFNKIKIDININEP